MRIKYPISGEILRLYVVADRPTASYVSIGLITPPPLYSIVLVIICEGQVGKFRVCSFTKVSPFAICIISVRTKHELVFHVWFRFLCFFLNYSILGDKWIAALTASIILTNCVRCPTHIWRNIQANGLKINKSNLFHDLQRVLAEK
jgi:hypothetical protein